MSTGESRAALYIPALAPKRTPPVTPAVHPGSVYATTCSLFPGLPDFDVP